MAEKKWFIPAAGSTVRVPATKQIVPPEGTEVDKNVYWQSRVDAGDGAWGERPSEKSKPAKKEA